MSIDPKPAVVLLSGGLDSTTTLAIARAEGFEPLALTFAYGQRQKVELDAAQAVARAQSVSIHKVVTIDLGTFGGSALTADIPVPKDRPPASAAVPVTYVPARNTIFLAYALAWAEVTGAFDIFLGVNAVDYSGYPDCRPEFVAAFERLANLATAAATTGRGRFVIHAPLLALSKAEIIKRGVALGVDYGLTRSCYDPQGDLACGHCDACALRHAGFVAAGLVDPTRYVTPPKGQR
ncbi:MAG: 7-cyano-7-deazaguanine synthase QueC [Deltaproteobacteria bacterium]|nr:7-cyano-7-deazaguanine synthase QueC [Deltaproteobacteria bacterium]